MQFQKIPIPPSQKVNGNSKGEGVTKAKFLKKSMEPNWNFQRGGVTNQKTFHGRGMDIKFSGNTLRTSMHQYLNNNNIDTLMKYQYIINVAKQIIM